MPQAGCPVDLRSDYSKSNSVGEARVHAGDGFLEFVDYARSMLTAEDSNNADGGGEADKGPSWSWIVSRILKTCLAYSTGVTPAILLSDLSQDWNEQYRVGISRRRPEFLNNLRKKKYNRTRLPTTVTIDSIYDKKFLPVTGVLEAVVCDTFLLPGTNIYMLKLGDHWSSSTIDHYLHCRYYGLVNCANGLLRKGREILLTGCWLRPATEGCGCARILPTEYLVMLLDEDEDDDAIFLGAHFCSDSFSSVSLDEIKNEASYSFYARIDAIGALETCGKSGSLQRKQVTLVDNDGLKLKFLLWGEQVFLANILSVGSMLALDNPFIAPALDNEMETSGDVCLEYGSATQLYVVPLTQREEQIFVASTPHQFQGSRISNEPSQTQGSKISQVLLPCDSQGSINFREYPFRAHVADLHDKMIGVSLYGTVTDIVRETNSEKAIFTLSIEDTSGAVGVKLHFIHYWSLGRLGIGHKIYISGLACSMTKKKKLEVTWFEEDATAAMVNLSCLPALLNSSCLYKLSVLSDLSIWKDTMHICCIWLDQIEYHHLNSAFVHARCGQLVNDRAEGSVMCNFCGGNCEGEIIRTFYFEVMLADESSKVLAWCVGQTAVEMLLVSPDEFYDLPEDEQALYLYTLENERFMVTLVNSKRWSTVDYQGRGNGCHMWEITCVLKPFLDVGWVQSCAQLFGWFCKHYG